MCTSAHSFSLILHTHTHTRTQDFEEITKRIRTGDGLWFGIFVDGLWWLVRGYSTGYERKEISTKGGQATTVRCLGHRIRDTFL